MICLLLSNQYITKVVKSIFSFIYEEGEGEKLRKRERVNRNTAY